MQNKKSETVVLAAAIIRNDRIFVAQRSPTQSHPLAWEFPGGKLEAGESHSEALRRELYEEFGILAHVRDFVAKYEQQSVNSSFFLHLYRCYVDCDEIHPLEHAAVSWASIEELYTIGMTPADAAILPELERVLRKNPSIWAATPTQLSSLPTKARSKHLFAAIQRPWTYVDGEPNLGAKARNIVASAFSTERARIVTQRSSSDATTRIIFEAKDGAIFETIHMPRELRSPRVSLCLSSQSGCAMNCAFCATAKLGLLRNLDASEIISQVHQSIEVLGPQNAHSINIVFMGMGEPLNNTKSVMDAIQILCHEHGLNIPDKRITLSSCGVISELPKLLNYPKRPNIAISLNAVNDELRSRLMPINKVYPLAKIRDTLIRWPYRSHEKIIIEYVLLAGVNDSIEDAKKLAEFTQGFPHNINIIPYNEAKNCVFKTPSQKSVQDFIKTLQDLQRLVTLRLARGVEVGGACGQLFGESTNFKHS
ncbi:MAG: NUDIX domain-containing protein [Bradymonadia bacterium]|jgi:23S rRNA (adenine2503-C2)-methyltransferase